MKKFFEVDLTQKFYLTVITLAGGQYQYYETWAELEKMILSDTPDLFTYEISL